MASKNYPTAQLDAIEPTKVQQLTGSLLELHQMGKPKTNDELKSRIDEYFAFCQRSSIRPGIESLCLAIHTNRETLRRWCRGDGCDEERQQIAQSARSVIQSFLEQASLNGALNPATAIFLMKNWLGYSDNYKIETEQTEKPLKSNEEIFKEISGAVGIDATRKEESENLESGELPYFD